MSESEGFDKRLQKASGKQKEKIENELSARVSTLMKDGVKIYTALDPYMQNQVVAQMNSKLPYADVQGGAAVINHQTHQIIALSGGKNYQNMTLTAPTRRTGSRVHPLSRFLITALILNRPARQQAAPLMPASFAAKTTVRKLQ